MKRTLLFVTLSLFSLASNAQVQKIRTIAGTGIAGYGGDGAASTSALLNGPLGVAVDTTGNVYIEDFYNFRVRKIATTGIITTIAGNGIAGNNGNGSIGSSAEVCPNGIAVDKKGNLYISDASYSVVRKVNALGIISTVAGTGVFGHTGDGGAATLARLRKPAGLAVDNHGNLYIADAGNHVIRKVDSLGKISTVAGNDTAGVAMDGTPAIHAMLDSPLAVAVDKIGNLYITDFNNNSIRKVDTAGNIYLFAGVGTHGISGDNGPAVAAELNNPRGIAVDTTGNLYIADADNNVIRKVDLGGTISTVVGNGTVGFGGDYGPVNGSNLHTPYGIAIDKYGTIFIADANNQRVRRTYSSVGVSNVAANGKLGIYPNPVGEELTVTGLSAGDQVCFFDVAGRTVGTTLTATATSQTISTSRLAAGMYMLLVTDSDGNKKTTLPVVKK